MWLLDVNLPNGLVPLLHRYGTRDRLFGTSARRAMAALPELAIVIVTLPQTRETAYLAEFAARWRQKPVAPVAGAIVEWP